MNNAALEAFLTQFKEKMCAIILDNNRCIYIGYNSDTSHTWDEIKTTTMGGVDFFYVKSQGHTQVPVVHYVSYYPTETIQGIYVMEDGYEDFRIDPVILK